MYRHRWHIILPLIVLTSPLLAQSSIKQNIKSQWGFVKREFGVHSERILEFIEKTYPNEVDSLKARASSYSEQKNWRESARWFQVVQRRFPEDLEAILGLAISKREIGVLSGSLQRVLIWRQSHSLFEKAVQLNRNYNDVLYQWAILERYKGNYDKAIQLAQDQIDQNTALSAQTGIYQFYDLYIENNKFDKAESWLKSRSTDYDRYFLGELYRRKGRVDAANDIFNALLSDPYKISKQAIYLSLLRLAVQTSDFKRAHICYWKAVNWIEDEVGATLVRQDIYPIVNREEFMFFQNPQTPQSFIRGLEIFWLKRNPLPATSVNHRLIEHYRRLIYANKNYRFDGVRHPRARADRLGRLPLPSSIEKNWKFDDRGLIYIRYGEPDDTAITVDIDLPHNISWLYYGRGKLPKMIFHFSIGNIAPPGYWTLIPGFTEPDILESMLNWDDIIHKLYRADDFDQHQFLLEGEQRRANAVAVAFENDAHRWPDKVKPLEMHHAIYRYRHDDVHDRIDVCYAVPKELSKSNKENEPAEISVAVFDTAWYFLQKQVHQPARPDSIQFARWNDRLIGTFPLILSRQPYNLALHGQEPSSNRLNGWKFRYHVASRPANDLDASSLKLAYEITPKTETVTSHRKDLNIIPNPTRSFKRKNPVFIYYEIYNLAFDSDGSTQYTVQFTLRKKGKRGLLSKITGIFSSGERYDISLQSEHSGNSRTVHDYISFDMSRLKKGAYEIHLDIEDLVTGEKVHRSAGLQLN